MPFAVRCGDGGGSGRWVSGEATAGGKGLRWQAICQQSKRAAGEGGRAARGGGPLVSVETRFLSRVWGGQN